MRRRKDIDLCVSKGIPFSSRGIRCLFLAKDCPTREVAFAIPGSTGNAVERNRCRRRLKSALAETLRNNEDLLPFYALFRGNARILNSMEYTKLREKIDKFLEGFKKTGCRNDSGTPE